MHDQAGQLHAWKHIKSCAHRYKGAKSYHEGGPADERMMEVAEKEWPYGVHHERLTGRVSAR